MSETDARRRDPDVAAAYRTNLAWWEERAALHPSTASYARKIERLRAGGDALHGIEVREVGDVRGKDLLHLQCHVGTDTLSWVRRGAAVTGVDFSAEALRRASALSRELGLPARFVHCNVYDVPEHVHELFDIVFASYGALIWLHDLSLWARIAAERLRPGGMLYVVDVHPMLFTIDHEAAGDGTTLRVRHPYFHRREPLSFTGTGSYAAPEADTVANETVEWPHDLAETLTAILDAGLAIELVGEHREAVWNALPCCVDHGDDVHRLPDELRDMLPLLFSVRARKPGGEVSP